MGLFDLFSNDTAEEAARQRNEGLQKGYDTLSTTFGQGRDALTTDFSKARDALGTGYGQASTLYSGLGDYFKNLYGGGAAAYGDATGANGAEGTARARANFQADPGRNFQLDQGLQALQRTHAAAGNLDSGNADADTLKLSQGIADQSYGNYVSRLAPYLQLAGTGATTATTGQAGAATGLAGGLAGLFQGEGTGVNASYQGQGAAANANYTGQGASDAAATMNNYNIAQNQLSAVKEGAKLAGSLFGAFV